MKKVTQDQVIKTLAKNIRILRKQKGLTQEDMAELGFNYRFYQKLESGKYCPSLSTVIKLANCFGVQVKDLL